MANNDIFARTMQACLESHKSATKPAAKTATKKAVTESKKVVKKPAKKSFYESKCTRLFEEDDFEAEMDELNAYETDNAVDVNDVDEVDDISDDIVVVVDPELDAEEISETAEDAQEVIDNTPEGEIPETDEYVGDNVYQCPVCGNTFFSADEVHAGDECPVCGETPDDFVLVGEVEEAEEVDETEVPADKEIPAEEEIPEDIPAEEEADVIDNEEDEVVEEDVSVGVAVDPDTDEVAVTVNPDEGEAVDEVEDLELNVDVPEEEVIDEVPAIEKKRPVRRSLNLDESTFDPFLTKFVRENYKNARSLRVKRASLNNGILTLECKLTFKSGNAKKVTLKAEGFKRVGSAVVAVKDDGTFKVESKKVAPIRMRLNTNKGIVKCEAMKYDFTTMCEGRRARVMSAPVMESKKAPVRKPVAKRPVRK